MTRKQSGCFLIGVTGPEFSRTGEALLGSVSDDPYDVRTFLRTVNPADALAHIGTELVSTSEHTLSERGYFAAAGETTRGVNAAGVAFTCAMVIEDEAAERTAKPTPYAELTEKMMRTCRTVDEAIELFLAAGATDPAYSVLLADAGGDLAHMEVGTLGINVNHRYSRDKPGAVFAVNCYLSEKLTAYNATQTRIENQENNNRARRERGKQLAEQLRGELDVRAVARILSDHANRDRDPRENPILAAWGYSICNHGTRSKDTYPHEDLPWGTVSAEILQPGDKRFWYAYGWACGERPQYGDQVFQDKSWGQFVPFGFAEDDDARGKTIPLTTSDGEITHAGLRWRTDREGVAGSG